MYDFYGNGFRFHNKDYYGESLSSFDTIVLFLLEKFGSR